MTGRSAFITVENKLDGHQMVFLREIENFSIILSDDSDSDTIVEIPQSVGLQSWAIEDVKRFAEFHKYNVSLVTFKPRIVYYKVEVSNKETQQFINEVLVPKSDEELRQLIKAADFLQVRLLSQVISIHLSNMVHLPIRESDAKKKLEDEDLLELSQQQLNELKSTYVYYFNAYWQRRMRETEPNQNLQD